MTTNENELRDTIMERAVEDSGYAIAWAILRLTDQVKYLGVGDASSSMGAIEFLATQVKEAGDGVARSIGELADAVQPSG